MSQPQVIRGPWVGATAVLMVLLIGTGMFYYQFVVLPVSIGPPHLPQNVVIELTANQWAFAVNGTIDTRSKPIVVHVGDNVTFHIRSVFQKDSSFNQHGFFIQGLMEVPITLAASMDVTVSIVPSHAGEYTIICTIFCGTGHGDMHGTLEVLP